MLLIIVCGFPAFVFLFLVSGAMTLLFTRARTGVLGCCVEGIGSAGEVGFLCMQAYDAGAFCLRLAR